MKVRGWIKHLVLIVIILAVGRVVSSTELKDLQYKAGDEKGNELRSLKAEMFIAKTEAQAVKQAKKLLRKYRGTTLEPDLQFRLGELYIRRSKTDRFLKMHRESETLVRFLPKKVRGAKPKNSILKAISYFEKIQKKWPNYSRLDQVLFNNAFANQQIQRGKRAEKLYKFMIKEFPGSFLVPDAHLALGEMQFRRKNFKEALKHFVAIRQHPNSMVYPYGIYKAAWTRYNLRDTQGALSDLEDVVKFGHMVEEKNIDSRLDLRKEALMDMALFYEDVRPASKAYDYFETQAKRLDVAPYILRLAKLYKRHSRHSDVRTLLSDFIDEKPLSASIPNAYLAMMEASNKLNKRKDVIVLLKNMSKVCHTDSKWSEGQGLKPIQDLDSPLMDLVDDPKHTKIPAIICMDAFRRTALVYSNKWLKVWKKDKKKTEYADSTEQVFEVYLKYDPKTPTSGKARFVYSELLFQRGKYRKASMNYATAGTIVKKKSLLHDAKYYALISLEKAVKDKWSDSDEKQFNIYAKDYLKSNPTSKFAKSVEFKIGFIAYEKERYKDAEPVFKKLANSKSSSEYKIKAQDLYLDILNIQKRYVELRDYSGSLKGQKLGKERKLKLTKIYEESYFLIIQDLEEKKKYKEAIKLYQAFASDNPKSVLTQKAMWNTIQLYYKTNKSIDAANASIRFADKYPKDKKSVDALMRAAQGLESMAQLNSAARVLLKLSDLDKKSAFKWTVLAADFYHIAGNFKESKKLYTSFLVNSDAKVVGRSLEKLEQIAIFNKSVKDREALLKKMIALGAQPYKSKAEVYYLEKVFADKKYPEAFTMARKVLGDRKGADSSSLAKARLIQARILADEFRNQSMKTRLDRVNLVLQLKTGKLDKAQRAYQSASRYNDPKVSVIALKELADLYMDYANAVRSMPLPAGVEAKEEQIFRQEMLKLAIPMEERGVETKVVALKQARALGLRNELVDQLKKEVEALNQTAPVDNLVEYVEVGTVFPQYAGVTK